MAGNEPAIELPVTSSQEPVLPVEQLHLYRRVLQGMVDERIPFAVAGAFAFQCYTGIWRFTKDLDLFLPREWMKRGLDVCARAGFNTEVRDPVWLAKAWHEDYFVDLISGMSNGVIWVTTEWISRARPGKAFGLDVPILGPEDLILSKIFVAHRERFDGADIAHILYSTADRLDWNLILQGAGEHWEILFWHLLFFRYIYPMAAHRVPDAVWRDLIDRLEVALTNSTTVPQPFRGSLIDDNMFRIDLHEWGLENLQQEMRARRLACDDQPS